MFVYNVIVLVNLIIPIIFIIGGQINEGWFFLDKSTHIFHQMKPNLMHNAIAMLNAPSNVGDCCHKPIAFLRRHLSSFVSTIKLKFWLFGHIFICTTTSIGFVFSLSVWLGGGGSVEGKDSCNCCDWAGYYTYLLIM